MVFTDELARQADGVILHRPWGRDPSGLASAAMALFPDRSLGLAPASVRDYRELARRRLPRQLFDYIDGGAYEESTLRANVDDLAAIHLRQRVLRDVSELQLATTVLGQSLAMPLVLGPVGLAGMYATRAEVQAAQAAEQMGIAFCESTVSICSIEEVDRATTAPFWFQLYVMRDRAYAEDLMSRASSVGCPVLVLTVDLAVVGARYREVRNGMAGPQRLPGRIVQALDFSLHPRWARDVAVRGRPHTFGNLEKAVPGRPARTCSRSGWTTSSTPRSRGTTSTGYAARGRVGSCSRASSTRRTRSGRRCRCRRDRGLQPRRTPARQHSVHDRRPASRRRRGGRLPRGAGRRGIRSGLDVVKALALGARACLVGRAWAWSVAAGGRQGVVDVLRTMRGELKVALSLTGAGDVHVLDPSALLDGDGRPLGA